MISRHFQKIVFVDFLRIMFSHHFCRTTVTHGKAFVPFLRLFRYHPIPFFVFMLFVLLLQLPFQFWFSKKKKLGKVIFKLQKCLSQRSYLERPFTSLRDHTAFSRSPVRSSYGDFVKLGARPPIFFYYFLLQVDFLNCCCLRPQITAQL